MVARRVDMLTLFLADAGRRDLARAAENIAHELRQIEREQPRRLRRVA